MTSVASVIDTSALLAYLKEEPGAAVVRERLLRGAGASTLIVQELVSKLVEGGGDVEGAVRTTDDLGLTAFDLTRPLAIEAGAMIAVTRPRGLSHGDRACLALARALGLPAVTADRAWAEVAGPLGVTVELVR